MSGKLELRLLGNPEVYQNGQPLSGFRSSKAQALLYYLAATQRAQSRPILAGLFWGDSNDNYARRNLNRTLSNLRQVVGDYLTITRQSVAFDAEGAYWLDIEALESVDTDADHLEKPAALYRGDFLEGFYIQDAPEFEQWVLTERARLREVAMQVFHALSAHHATQGDLLQAVDMTRQILNLGPWREEAHRQLMLFLAQNGQRSAALTQFETCRQVLAEELSVEPSAETVDLYNRIRNEEITTTAHVTQVETNRVEEYNTSNTPSVPTQRINQWDKEGAERGATPPTRRQVSIPAPVELPTPHHNLPIQPTPFVGRGQELTDIIDRLYDPDCRLLTLIGPGGIGKTRLAIEASQRLVDDERHRAFFANGIFFVALQPLDVASDIASTIAEAIHLRFYGDASPEQQLLNFLHAKQMLLVLDNFEHLLEGTDLVSDILTTAAGVTILVTSREELGLQEAWFHPIARMSFPKTDAALDTLEAEFDAIQLFEQRARRAHTTFALAEEQQQVVHICQLVDGMPLGIELAAAWTRSLSCREIVEEIERSLDFLSTSLRNVPERHRSLRALFEQTWQRLSLSEREVLSKMSVFRGGCTREAAEAVTDATLSLLASLVDKALVRRTRSGRYEMHELLRQFATEQLHLPSNAPEQIQDRHCSYFATFVQARVAAFKSGRQKESLAAFTIDIDNIRAAWNYAIACENWQTIEQMAECFWILGEYQGALREGEIALQQAVTALRTKSAQTKETILTTEQEQLIGFLLAAQGYLCGRQVKYDEGLTLAKQGLATLRQTDIPDMWKETMTLMNLGFTMYFHGYHTEARQVGQESLALFAELGDRWGMIECYIMLGSAAEEGGQLAESERHLQACLSICLETGELLERAYIFEDLTRIDIARGAYARAKEQSDEQIKIRQEFDDSLGMLTTLTEVGRLAIAQGNYTQAVQFLQQSHTMYNELGIVKDPDNLHSLGSVWRLLGDYEASERLLTRSLNESKEFGHPTRVAHSLSGLACLNYDRQQFHQAEQQLREAYVLWKQVSHEPEMASVLRHRARVLVALGEPREEEARQSFKQALQLAIKHGLAPIALDIFVSVTKLLIQKGETHRSIELLALSDHQTASTYEKKEKARQQLAELTDGLSSNVVSNAKEQGQARDWRETAQQLIETLTNPDQSKLHPSVPNNLPTQLTLFVGREQDLSNIAGRLQEPNCRLLTLIGPGGIGKTRLAIATAERLLNPPTNQPTNKPTALLPRHLLRSSSACKQPQWHDFRHCSINWFSVP